VDGDLSLVHPTISGGGCHLSKPVVVVESIVSAVHDCHYEGRHQEWHHFLAIVWLDKDLGQLSAEFSSHVGTTWVPPPFWSALGGKCTMAPLQCK